MLFRAPLLAFTVLTVWAGDAAAQTACVVAGFDTTCAGNSLTFCDATDAQGAAQSPITNTIDCATFATGATGVVCGEAACTGAGCGDNTSCIGGAAGATCIGESVFYVDSEDANGDGTPDAQESFLAIQCGSGLACSTVVSDNAGQLTIADTCVATTETCTAAAARCDGQIAVTCYAASGTAGPLTLNHPTLVDCATFPAGTTCAVDSTGAAPFAFCDVPAAAGEGEGEGEGEDDDNGNGRVIEDPPEDAPACSGVGSNAALPTFAGLALALVALRRRRR